MWLDWLFPPLCQACGKIGHWVCRSCLQQVEFYPNPVPMTLAEKPALTQVLAATYFQPPISQVIKALKYRGTKDVAKWLGQWLYEVAPIPEIDYITAIPLHATKQAVRTYNQAELIAQSLAHQLQLPYLPLLIKNRATQAQATVIDKTQRLTQLEGVFNLRPEFAQPIYLDKLKNSHILLVDDVVTTGATLNSAAQVLKQSGIGEITGLAVAHGQ